MPLNSLFFAHSVSSTKKDLKKMFFNFMCSDAAESSIERQSAAESYLILKKILSSIENKKTTS